MKQKEIQVHAVASKGEKEGVSIGSFFNMKQAVLELGKWSPFSSKSEVTFLDWDIHNKPHLLTLMA